MDNRQTVLFEKMPVAAAVRELALPSIMGQIILVIYNMADTYFVGLTGNDAMITAVTVCLPAFMFLSAISNLFGIGGGASYSRALGKQKVRRKDNIAAHALFGCILVTAVYCGMAGLFRHPFIDLLGGRSEQVHAVAVNYLLVTVTAGGLTTALGTMFSHLIRAEGNSSLASIGVIMGGVLNIVLDPLFMFVILPEGNEVLGAAIATALSNTVSFLYFVILLKTKSHLVFRWHDNAFEDGSAREVIRTGLPACLMTLFENISYAVLDGLMASYGIAAQAGIGVAKKVNMLAHSVVRGLAQGVLPLIAYNYAAKNYARMKDAFRLTALTAVAVSSALTAVYFIFSPYLIRIFISSESESLRCGTVFLRILCIGCPFSAFAYTVISFFQAVNKGIHSFCLAMMRKGTLDIPMMFILMLIFGSAGIVAATPAADILCAAAAGFMVTSWIRERKMKIEAAAAAGG